HALTQSICHNDQDSYYLLRKQLVATGAPQSGQLCMRRGDGTLFWVLLEAAVAQDPSGAPVHRIILIDITARKQVELDYRIAATVFESQEGMLITDASEVILRVNKAFTDITGYTTGDVLGKTPQMLCSDPQDAAMYVDMWRDLECNGAWQGELWTRRKNGEAYPARLTVTAVKNANQVVSHYVATFSDVTASKMADEKIKNLAFYDPLTHLPNRRLLMDRLEVALAASLRYQRKGALMFIDLDGFKTINDTLGHLQGDLLLEQVANRLNTCVRDGDTVARLGGDEFVVMLEQLSEDVLMAATEAKAAAEKILTTLDHVYPLSPTPCRITCSIGITLFGENPGETPGEPMKRADLAMYQAKAGGRNALRFFDPQMQAIVTARIALENGLREAMEQGELRLHYQPQMEGHAHLVGVEALVRWQRPLHGLVLPTEFIAVSEETGLILPLGHWVLETACAQLALWAQRVEMSHLTMSVNVSASQFHQSDFVQEVLGVLERTGANPYQLKLELTESVMVSGMEDVIAKMGALKKHGVRFALDDFGTGYSSLAYLKRMPLEQLKIDLGFVRDILTNPNDAAISKMVIALAESIGLTVIAEGVETSDQRDFLASQGCHAYQGFLSSRPLPLDEFEAFAELAS
ncbi:MAG TPA: EAL domain-containing protein, partial [Rhodoferax sp.]